MAILTIARQVDSYVYAQKVKDFPLTFELARELLGRDLDLRLSIHYLVALILVFTHFND